MGVAMDAGAGKMPRNTRKCFSESGAPKFVAVLFGRTVLTLVSLALTLHDTNDVL